MKIEKINDRQIRCTLTREDLASRNINVRELAYGTEKAKKLFQDMMQVAAADFGFEADNFPLVIEAIPVSLDTIILIITKVEDPEELDTRFARFSPEEQDPAESFSFSDLGNQIEGADDILDLIKKLSEARKRAEEKTEPVKKSALPEEGRTEETEDLANLMRAYSFRSLDDAIRAAAVLGDVYDGPNSLYKSQEDGGVYYLMLKKGSCSAEQFNKICNILSEYAVACKYVIGMDAYFNEHMDVLVEDNALQTLRQIS